jgi:hypothetical protein
MIFYFLYESTELCLFNFVLDDDQYFRFCEEVNHIIDWFVLSSEIN